MQYNVFLASIPILYLLKLKIFGGMKWEHWPEMVSVQLCLKCFDLLFHAIFNPTNTIKYIGAPPKSWANLPFTNHTYLKMSTSIFALFSPC